MQSRRLHEDGHARMRRNRHMCPRLVDGERRRVGAGFTTPGMALAGIAMLLLSCGDGVVNPIRPPTPTPVATGVTINPATAELTALGATVQLRAEVRDQNGRVMAGATVTWTSGDASVATVDVSGLATAVGSGTARITATAGSASATAVVTVAVDRSANSDRAVLEVLYGATDGPNWNNNENWLSDLPLGEWYGVETDVVGRVSRLNLGNNALVGVIPAELGELDVLLELDLSENGLYGNIPPELGRLVHLRTLLLRVNLLSRTIPPELGKLARLHHLFLDHNRLEGAIPPDLGNLRELRLMRLSHNDLSGPIPPQLGSLNIVDWLDLSDNNLTGPIPPELGNLASIRVLGLSSNDLTGPIPPELDNLTGLEDLVLGNNGLTGPIPPWLAGHTQLETLALQGNELTGPIPPWLGNLAELSRLLLSDNDLTGPIPPELGNLQRLEWLGLGGNRLTGRVPSEFGNLREMRVFTLSGNLLTGSLPETLVELDNLVTLGCRETRGVCMPATVAFREWAREVEARGSIQNAVDVPWCDALDREALERLYEATNGDGWSRSDGWLEAEDLGQWHGVRTDPVGRVSALDLGRNGLSGHLPDAMGLLASMTELRIGSNALSGRMPLSLADVSLEEFDYADTSLCVADDAGFRAWLNGIPHHAGTGEQCPPLTEREALEWLYRQTGGSGWNASTGWLTDAPVAQWHGVETDAGGQVVELSLPSNGLSGSIPPEIGELSALTTLHLGSNRLEGGIPPEIGELSELRVLNLYHNALRGPIPAEVGALPKLTNLNLQGNRLSGAIPREIAELSELRELELGYNILSGPIPPEIANLAHLVELGLQQNQLSGAIPREIGRLVNLRDLALFNNRLSGPVPAELGALDRLRRLDLSRNQLSGSIPGAFGRLSTLELLDLGDNELSGAIPEEISRLADLAELHLAGNGLSGPVPAGLGDLANLVELDLGDNQLTGRLPAELGRATSLENLDLRSNALSGSVPPEFANLASLKSLILADNPDLAGPLPPGIRGLARVERFMAGGTGLCRPADTGFDVWFGAIRERRLVRCEGGSSVYLTQAVQSWDDPVPLLAGEPALLRVFVTAAQGGTVAMPEVRATFYVDGTERHTVRIAAGTRALPQEVTEGDLELSANAEIPDWVIAPGLEMVIEVDPEATLDPALGVTKRIPAEGRMAVDVRAVPPFNLTLIPFLDESRPDASIVESVLGMAEDPGGHELLADVRTLLPITELAVTAHEPVTTSFRDPHRLLGQTGAMRIMEGGSGYWMGLIQPPPRSGGRDWYFLLPTGIATAGGQTSVSIPEPSVMAHELGHNLSLLHAPCGGPSHIDPWFPYPVGNTGAWGYDFAQKAPVSPRTADLMSYCKQAGYWISDFFFNKALNHRLASSGPEMVAAASTPTRSLLVWGGRDQDGVPYLDPAFVVDAPPSLPAAGGDYTIEGESADGTPIFSLTFDMPVNADAEGEETSFVFALPLEPEWAGNLGRITLSGTGGADTLDESTDRPMAILRDPQSGRVRAFLRDQPPAAQAPGGDAADHIGEPDLERLFSRGIPDAAAWGR